MFYVKDVHLLITEINNLRINLQFMGDQLSEFCTPCCEGLTRKEGTGSKFKQKEAESEKSKVKTAH